jgi:hypothetical protein
VVDPAAIALITQEMAERYRAIPVAIESDAIRILVCSPLDLTELEDLADLLDRPLQPLITPEYRWNLVFANTFGVDPPARFTTLARTLDAELAAPPVGRAPTIIIESVGGGEAGRAEPARSGDPASPAGGSGGRASRARDDSFGTVPNLSELARQVAAVHAGAARLAPVPADADTLRMLASEALPTLFPDDGRVRRHTIIGLTPNRAATDGGAAPSSDDDTPPSGTRRASRSSAPHLAVSGSTAAPAPAPTIPAGGLGRPVSEARLPGRPSAAPRPTPIPTEGRDSPLPIVRAREILATAADRDTVFLTLLRAARSRARWAGLLTVQGGAAIGRVALAEPGIDSGAVNTVLIPLDSVSPFRTVVNNHQPHIGPLVSGDPGIDSMVLRMGGTVPPSALILPIVLRDRVVALVIAHRLHSDLKLVDVTELLPMANAACEALGRLIVKHKTAGHRAPRDPAIVEVEAEMIDTKRISRADVDWSVPTPAPSAPRFEQGVEMSIEAGEPRPIDDVLGEIERSSEGGAEDAIAEAIERAAETLRALVRRFPGKLRVDRLGVTGRHLRAGQYGGLLELVVRLGGASADLLVDRMSVAQRDIRFYATVCAAELRPRNAVFALAERLFDQDFGVRACAIEALAGYPPEELGHALVRARRAVHSTDPDVVAAAASAVIALGDVDAIPDLIGVIERADRGGDHARRALTSLAAQDFGASERKWRKWYEAARRRHRIEWLIDGLGHKEDAIRETAINSLRRLTGEYFGYHHDLPRKERDAAAERWAAWWRDSGHRRFATASDGEPPRTTGELPVRREP